MASATPNRAQRRAAQRNGHTYLSIRDFEHDRVVPIEIDGWGTVLYELPDLSAELALGLVPNHLRAALTKALTVEPDGEDRDPEDLKEYFLLQADIVARHLREPDVMAHCNGDEEAAREWVLRMPPAIRTQLWTQSVLHNISPSAFAETFRLGRAKSRPSQDSRAVEAAAQ